MVTTRGGEHAGSSARPQANINQATTDVRRSKRNVAATPATLDSPDHVLQLQFDSAAATKPVGNKSKSRISRVPSTKKKSKLPTKPVAEINATLSPACLIEIFKRCDDDDDCIKSLPLVCKHWAEILRAPSAVWETLEISDQMYDDPILSYGKVLNWITPRSKGITNLTFNVAYCGKWAANESPTEKSDVAATNFRSILKLVAPSLKSLKLHCPSKPDDDDDGNDGYGFCLTWGVLKDLAGAAQTLTSLEMDFIQGGSLLPEHAEDLKVFENLERLDLSWTKKPLNVRTASPSGVTSSNLPSGLFDLTKLKYLSLNSETITGTFPRDVERLQHLTELKLENTKLTKIETWPKELIKLSISGSVYGQEILNNGFWDIIPIQNHLDVLDMSACNIKKLNGTYTDERIDDPVAHCPLMHVEPSVFNLSNNPLGDLSQSRILYSATLDGELNLSNCGLSVFPEEAAERLDTLEILNLSKNNLVDLPRELEAMTRLKKFRATRNNFPAIPEVLKTMPSLVYINIGFSRYLEVSKSISPWVLKMKNLKYLYLFKEMGQRYQVSSLSWLQEAEKELTKVGRGTVLQYGTSVMCWE